ncbi:GNAT family N-acetyltransferase [Bacillus coahuilensis]|uniref:GNAT family N-acetyltransferase n=1 Tax=Bacillus coahuilensis TaxID=408580 RepID=UPI0023BA141E|nr:GNAT family N-acetyltransferase [Bacillus coahuilensis]
MEWSHSKEFLMQWAGPGFTYPLTMEQLVEYNKVPSTHAYSVVVDNKQVGHIALSKIDTQSRTARVGKVLVGEAALRGKGIGETMMKHIVSIAFNELGLNQVRLGVFDFNHSALALYKKLGFELVTVVQHARQVGDEKWTLYEMLLTREAWKICKES